MTETGDINDGANDDKRQEDDGVGVDCADVRDNDD